MGSHLCAELILQALTQDLLAHDLCNKGSHDCCVQAGRNDFARTDSEAQSIYETRCCVLGEPLGWSIGGAVAPTCFRRRRSVVDFRTKTETRQKRIQWLPENKRQRGLFILEWRWTWGILLVTVVL